jgi:hypothetical protein
MLDFIGHVGEVMLLWGTFRVARGHAEGFKWRLLGNILWCRLGWEIELTSVWFWCGVFVFVDGYGWWRAKFPPRGIR